MFKNKFKGSGKATVLCSPASGSRPFTFEWLKNYHQIINSDKIKIDNQAEHSILTIEPVSIDDNGNYTCFLNNPYGSDSYTARLVVHCKYISILFQ